MKVNILGTEYLIEKKNRSEDEFLQKMDGYCDKTTKRIVVTKKDEECEVGEFEVYQKSIIRHEIIHAFMYESGLDANFEHANQFGHEETMIDWIAIQFPKLYKAFEAAGCL